MKKLREHLCEIWREREDVESGVTTVEYAIMLLLIALAVASFGTGLSGSVSGVFSRLVSVLAAAT